MPQAIDKAAELIAEAGAAMSRHELEQVLAWFKTEMAALQREHDAGLARIRQHVDGELRRLRNDLELTA